MKTLLSILILVNITSSAFAQNGGNYDELMRQSRKARTTSTILVSVGPVIAAGGVGTLLYGLLANEFEEPGSHYDSVTGYSVPNERKKHTAEIVAGAAGTLVGIGLALTSIHFSSKASELKREARKTKLKTSTDRISIPGFQNSLCPSGVFATQSSSLKQTFCETPMQKNSCGIMQLLLIFKVCLLNINMPTSTQCTSVHLRVSTGFP